MAKYDNETKFYYLQVKEDFFDDDAIVWLEDRENGEKYSNFYLKLCLKSLKTNGILIKKVGTMLIPYDIEALRKLTGVKDIDTVKVAMDLLVKAGLVQITEERAIYISQLENLVGSRSLGALKKQQQLERKKQQSLQGGKGVENFPPNIEQYIEQELDIELDINNSNNNNNNENQQSIYEIIENEFGRLLSPIEIEIISKWEYPLEILKMAVTEATSTNNLAIKYIDSILYNWNKKNLRSVAEVEKYLADYRERKSNRKANNLPDTAKTGANYYPRLD